MAYDCNEVVIGSGIIGLAVARARARAGNEVLVLESEPQPLLHISSRNSEIIHAGLYYTPGSWKARLCVTGRNKLYEYLRKYCISYRRCGKLVVATDEMECRILEQVQSKARENGVADMEWLEQRELEQRAPALRGVAALLSPSTGIFDSHSFAQALLSDVESAGSWIVCHQKVEAITERSGNVVIKALDMRDQSTTELVCQRAFNCAGHGAINIYHQCCGFGPRRPYSAGYAKGNYATVSGTPPTSELVYPVPKKHGLGIHVTIDLADRVRLGPDVQWVEHSDDYDVDNAFTERARAAAARYWPDVVQRTIGPDYAGVRPKVAVEGTWLTDFVFEFDRSGADEWQVAHCLGIESPGLTATLAIADMLSNACTYWADISNVP